MTDASAPLSIVAVASVGLVGESQQGVVVEWKCVPLFSFSSSPSPLMLTLVATGASPDDPVQVEGDSMGSVAGGFVGAISVSSGLLVTSALLVKPVKALDGAAMDPKDTRVGFCHFCCAH